MKNTATFVLVALCLAQAAFAISCSDGYYDAANANQKCYQCPEEFTTCTSASAGTVVKAIVGYKDNAGVPARYCSGSYYNKNTDNCQLSCKKGCSSCKIDYDFCTDCNEGYVWNADYTCLPATIGLAAASLALLAIALVFGIIGCCTVIKAKKN